MVKENLQFFGKDGYNLNFDWNAKLGYWEGSIYLPRVSVGLYANTSLYVLEKIGDDYSFPKASKPGDKIKFTWEYQNNFVDEFFMFNFDDTYVIKDTSALVYTPNDGPDCETLIVNRFDKYEIDLDEDWGDESDSDASISTRPIPIHIAFSASDKYDATTYKRTLIMSYNGLTIAKIRFFAETIEEDERLKIWNDNLGYNITPEDTMIFYKSDIKETKPDYKLLNEKRKELMMEGSNIYPYIGSYKAIINAIKFFGYSNLSIIEYWKNVNYNDENFGKIYHASKYSLTKKETLNIGSKIVALPNKDYKKINRIALVYSINQPTGNVDDWELPIMEENFTYTIEEALVKLFALKKKLNKEFMPGTSRIVDIIGEGNYFGIQGVTKTNLKSSIHIVESDTRLEFEAIPGRYVHLSDNRYFNKYILDVMHYEPITLYGDSDSDSDSDFGDVDEYYNYDFIRQFDIISEMSDNSISDVSNNQTDKITYNLPDNKQMSQLYEDYYKEVFVDHTRYEDHIYEDNDTDDENTPVSAKVVLSNTSFDGFTFGDSEIDFDYRITTFIKHIDDNSDSDPENDTVYYSLISREDDNINPLTFENVDTYGHETITWTITMSKGEYNQNEQVDDELKSVGISKTYPRKNFTKTITGSLLDYKKIFVSLPYVGYYDVTMNIDDKYIKTQKKYIKVEPYDIELRGFYYDARELPKNIKYDNPEEGEMYAYIQEKLEDLTDWARTERTEDGFSPIEFSMPTYSVDQTMINTGPYKTGLINTPWYLLDNISYDISLIEPYVKYARYIRNGVDVKPYTWFLLTYNYGKISGKREPTWTIRNNMIPTIANVNPIHYTGKYLTCLLKTEGDYTIELSLKDTNGNEYTVSRNIFVVNDTANHILYQTFKKEYDDLMERKELALTRNLEMYDINNNTIFDPIPAES